MIEILIIEDDVTLNNGIALSLKQDGYSFCNSFTLKEAKEYLKFNAPNLIILDINLPDGNGLDLCKEIRKTSPVPIIFLTANNMETDIVAGFSLGCDDYITKPFSLMILRARVAAVLKRTNLPEIKKYEIDNFVFDFDSMEFYKDGTEIILSKTEQKLLKILVSNIGKTLTRNILIDKIWTDGTEYVDENALTVTISRLRNKLEQNPNKPHYIKTVYGIGYVWSDSPDG